MKFIFAPNYYFFYNSVFCSSSQGSITMNLHVGTWKKARWLTANEGCDPLLELQHRSLNILRMCVKMWVTFPRVNTFYPAARLWRSHGYAGEAGVQRFRRRRHPGGTASAEVNPDWCVSVGCHLPLIPLPGCDRNRSRAFAL